MFEIGDMYLDKETDTVGRVIFYDAVREILVLEFSNKLGDTKVYQDDEILDNVDFYLSRHDVTDLDQSRQ